MQTNKITCLQQVFQSWKRKCNTLWKKKDSSKSFCITLCSFTPLESHALAFSKMSYNKSNPPLVQKVVLEGNCSVELGCPNIRCCDSWRFSRPLSCWSALFVFNLACCYPESAYFIWRECQEKEPNLIDSKDLICFAPSGLICFRNQFFFSIFDPVLHDYISGQLQKNISFVRHASVWQNDFEL